MQSCPNNFPYIRDDFRKNCEEETSLGAFLDRHSMLTSDDGREAAHLEGFRNQTAKKRSKSLGVIYPLRLRTGKPPEPFLSLLTLAQEHTARHSSIRFDATGTVPPSLSFT